MKNRDKHCYDDILHLPHHVSSKHPHMSLQDRAAQFSPFAALTGHDDAIKETARITAERLNLDENSKAALDMRLQLLIRYMPEKPVIMFTYFKPDEKKNGGSYVTITGTVRKIDEYQQRIILDDGAVIPIHEIVAIEGSLFTD